MPLSSRNFRIALLAFVAASLTVIFLSLERGISHRRWPVKTLADADRSLVAREKVVDATVAGLISLPRVPLPLPRNHRIAPHELTVYRIRARLIAVREMLDGDFHVTLADPESPAARMIVEIPAEREGAASGLSESWRRARRTVRERGANGRLVRITGVGFFDYTHWQPGAAGNGFELHPVLSVEFLMSPINNKRGLLAEPSGKPSGNRESYIAAFAVRWISVAHIFPSLSFWTSKRIVSPTLRSSTFASLTFVVSFQ